MFLDRLLKTNEPLAQLAFAWQQDGTVLPDTYLIDLDMLTKNAESIKAAADAHDIKLYFMLKQLGRNPMLAHHLADLGYAGAVCVDFREALVMAEAGVPLGNVGHLVQTPRAAMERIVAARPDIMTVYSVEKAAEIGAAAKSQGIEQPIMLRVIGEGDMLYPGQYGGFPLVELGATVDAIEALPGVRIAGVCSFPCLLFSEEAGRVVPTLNADTVRRAAAALEARGYHDLQLNMPSASCTDTVGLVAELGGTHMEPGHGLSGTSYCYAGGHYRRGHLSNALVGTSLGSAKHVHVTPPADECIDYHFELSEPSRVDDGVLMCFRTQLFVTRSEVAVVSGLSHGKPQLEGIFDTQGHQLR